MFVREQDAVEAFGRATDRGQAFADLAAGKSGVDEEAGFAGFQIGAISAGTAAKNRELNCHWRTSVGNRFSQRNRFRRISIFRTNPDGRSCARQRESGCMDLTPLFAFTDGDRWRLGIGDPTVIGWFTVLAYFAAALLCWRAAKKGLHTAKVRWFWTALAALLIFLGINKQLDLQTAFTFMAKDFAKATGWYENRR